MTAWCILFTILYDEGVSRTEALLVPRLRYMGHTLYSMPYARHLNPSNLVERVEPLRNRSHTLQRVDLPCQFTDRNWIRSDTRNCPELGKKEWGEEKKMWVEGEIELRWWYWFSSPLDRCFKRTPPQQSIIVDCKSLELSWPGLSRSRGRERLSCEYFRHSRTSGGNQNLSVDCKCDRDGEGKYETKIIISLNVPPVVRRQGLASHRARGAWSVRRRERHEWYPLIRQVHHISWIRKKRKASMLLVINAVYKQAYTSGTLHMIVPEHELPISQWHTHNSDTRGNDHRYHVVRTCGHSRSAWYDFCSTMTGLEHHMLSKTPTLIGYLIIHRLTPDLNSSQ